MWMGYGGVVCDVTDFIADHPGGSISTAAGTFVKVSSGHWPGVAFFKSLLKLSFDLFHLPPALAASLQPIFQGL
jgi:hypothetical protein